MKRITILALATALALAAADNRPRKTLGSVNGREITEEDIRQKAHGALARLETQMYQVRKQALSAVVADFLLEEQAKKEGMTVDQLMKREIETKVGAVTDAEVEKFYEDRRTQIQKPIDEVRPQIVEAIRGNRVAMLRADYVKKLRESARVQTSLEAPVVEVPLDGQKAFARGNPRAPVTIVEFSDYTCGYCAKAETELARLQEIYKDKVQLILKDYPRMEASEKPLQAAHCAGEQGKQAEYHRALFANQKALGQAETLNKLAGEVGLDAPRFAACLDEGRYAARVRQDKEDGDRAGVSGTPTFFINGRMLQGAQPLATFREVIDEVIQAK